MPGIIREPATICSIIGHRRNTKTGKCDFCGRKLEMGTLVGDDKENERKV